MLDKSLSDMKKIYFILFLLVTSYSYGQTNSASNQTDSQKKNENSFHKTLEIKGFKMYPNPVKNGILRINTFENAEKKVQIFDVLGKQVFSRTIKTEHLSVATLNSGIYILKVFEKGKTTTRKLVIE